jgi:hypothetical protein
MCVKYGILQVPTAVIMSITFFLDVTSCSLVDHYQRLKVAST